LRPGVVVLKIVLNAMHANRPILRVELASRLIGMIRTIALVAKPCQRAPLMMRARHRARWMEPTGDMENAARD
jgi:hypothetical protein